jgi:hypothetical protein
MSTFYEVIDRPAAKAEGRVASKPKNYFEPVPVIVESLAPLDPTPDAFLIFASSGDAAGAGGTGPAAGRGAGFSDSQP